MALSRLETDAYYMEYTTTCSGSWRNRLSSHNVSVSNNVITFVRRYYRRKSLIIAILCQTKNKEERL